MQRSYTIDVAEDASALTDIEPFSSASAEFLEPTDVEGETPETWLGEHFMDITDDGEALMEEHCLDTTLDRDIPEASLEEQFIDNTDNERNIPEDFLDKFFLDIANVADEYIPEASPADMDNGDILEAKVGIPEWIFLISNVLIELLSAAFDQLSSVNKPRYALIAMLMSFVAAITCIIQFAYKAGKERVIWRWESKLPWFYYSYPSHRRFGSFPEMIGLVCAMLQAILSAVAYTFYIQHADFPLKVSFWPVVFALGLLCSKFMKNPNQVSHRD